MKITGYRGVTDLLSVYPYDEIDGEKVFNPKISGFTEKHYLANKKNYGLVIEKENEKYIKYLKENDLFEEEYEVDLEVQGKTDIELFNKMKEEEKEHSIKKLEELRNFLTRDKWTYDSSKESYRMTFLNFDEE